MKSKRLVNGLRAAVHLLVLRPLVKLFCGVHVTGSLYLRPMDRFLIIANHNSHLDVILLFLLLSVRDLGITHAVAEERYFARSRLIFGLVNFLFQPVWVRRGQVHEAAESLNQIRTLLETGHNIVLFPEGTRGRPGELLPFKSGLGRMLSRYPDVPIIPVFLSGPERVLPKACTLPLPFWSEVLVGPAQTCTGEHRDITHHLQHALRELARSSTASRRPRRRRRQAPATAVAVLGIDGSGKSTLSNLVTRRLSIEGTACLMSDRLEFFDHGEPKPLQPLGIETVRGMLGRYAKRAESLAGYKIPKLTELILRDRLLGEVDRWYAPRMIVQDGSPLLNMAAWAALYGLETVEDDILAGAMAVLAGERLEPQRREAVLNRMPELRQLNRLGLAHLRLPHRFILLDIPPTTACERIAARGKPCQPHETEEKLQRLRDGYLRVVRLVSERWSIPARILDGCQPIDQLVAQAVAFFSETANHQMRR